MKIEMKNEKKMYKLKKKEEDCVYVSEHKVLNIFFCILKLSFYIT